MLPEQLVTRINRFNAAHAWNHNNYYHPWVLRQREHGDRSVSEPQPAAAPPLPMSAPITPANMTLADIRDTAGRLIPGFRLRRGLFWRYLLTFTAPPR
ncbi:hypothetical protein GCM10010464_09800 [Pseudonocardia yunnanensis]|uniref:Uncharacterized protein n=1 Tax=Pseudonocardia yunnanensis TaxID=58107 RepID=A0ABW4EUC2_9PSEU